MAEVVGRQRYNDRNKDKGIREGEKEEKEKNPLTMEELSKK